MLPEENGAKAYINMDLYKELSKFNCISFNIFQSSTEISEYSSDSEKEEDSENVVFIDSESSPKYHMDFGFDDRQMMERPIKQRVKSAETVLYTPQKQTFPRTPETSANKKKLLRLNYTFLKIFLYLSLKSKYLKC